MRNANVFFITIFMVMLVLPLVFVNMSTEVLSVQENRMLASRPTLEILSQNPGAFKSQFDAWFSDNLGFREKLISLYKKLDYFETEGQYKNGMYVTLIGEKGHHYFADINGSLIPKFQGKSFLTDEQLQGMTEGLNDIKGYLDKKNIPLVVMFGADKESIYPEYYPKSIYRGSEPIQLDIITDYVKEHSNLDIFNIRECLIAEKNNFLLYPISTGDLAHYNDFGALFAYRELMKHINVYLPQLKSYALEDFNITYNDYGMPDLTLKEDITFERTGADFFDNVGIEKPFTWENAAFINEDQDLPTILFLRDSYTGSDDMPFFYKYLPQQFSKSIFIYYTNLIYFEQYIDIYKPDIVVIQSCERQLGWLSNLIIESTPLDASGE